MKTSLAVTYAAHGKPLEVLKLEERPRGAVGAGEVRLKMLAAAVHPSDFGQILGNYGKLRTLPAVGGREGVAEVVEVGSGVALVKVGDWARMPEEQGVWQEEVVVPAAGLALVPNDLPVETAAMAWINPPTAWRVLRDANLERGSWVAQNAANSAVGLCVIQMARHLGVKTINVVRRPELVEPLKGMGADVVVLEDSGYEASIGDLTGGQKPSLALNSVGGESAMRLLKILADGGRLVTFGAMTFEAVRFPTRQLIFNDVRLTGFWLDRWYRQQTPERVQVMMDKLFSLMRQGIVRVPVAAAYPLAQWQEALTASQQPRLGKVVFRG